MAGLKKPLQTRDSCWSVHAGADDMRLPVHSSLIDHVFANVEVALQIHMFFMISHEVILLDV